MDKTLIAILEKIKCSRGIDFTQYKEPTIQRRIRRRMCQRKISSYEKYLNLVEHDSIERDELIANIFINATKFFRDKDLFKIIETKVIPKIISNKKEKNSNIIRVWSPGCASGEEVYSVGIAFAQALQVELGNYNITIYGTDLDEEIVSVARSASYNPDRLVGMDSRIVNSYFVPNKDFSKYKICDKIRKMAKFGFQDLVSDSPISHLDLLICRNVLIYFSKELQKKILPQFHYALNKGGFLILGKAEGIGEKNTSLFNYISKKWRVYCKN